MSEKEVNENDIEGQMRKLRSDIGSKFRKEIENEIRKIKMSERISVKDRLPEMYESYDFSGRDVMVSNDVITNKGVAVYKDGSWRTISWDSSESDRLLSGVTHWMDVPLLGEEN